MTTTTGRMHSASVDRSDRLQRMRDLLHARAAIGATTREIILAADVCAVSAVASELRENGIGVVCLPEGRTESSNAHRYWLEEFAPEWAVKRYAERRGRC